MTVVRFKCGIGRGKDMDGSSTCMYIFWVIIKGSTIELLGRKSAREDKRFGRSDH